MQYDSLHESPTQTFRGLFHRELPLMPPYELPEFLKITLLAIVQGIAEFLPISSSGHLVVLNALFGTREEDVLGLGIVLHAGTLLAILVFYHRRILALLNEDRRVIPLLLVGTLPAAVIGIYLKRNFEWLITNPLLTGWMLVVTGLMLLLLTRFRDPQTPETNEKETGARPARYQQMGFRAALAIGMAQAFAILPGISRSGSTIVAGAALGLKQQSAATFSFLLAIPAIGGAALLEVIDLIREPPADGISVGLLAWGAVVAFGVGLAALRWLVRSLERGNLYLFAFWVIPLGLLVVAWQIWGVTP